MRVNRRRGHRLLPAVAEFGAALNLQGWERNVTLRATANIIPTSVRCVRIVEVDAVGVRVVHEVLGGVVGGVGDVLGVGPRVDELGGHVLVHQHGRRDDPAHDLRDAEDPEEHPVELADDVAQCFAGGFGVAGGDVGEVGGLGRPQVPHAEPHGEGGRHERVVVRVVVGGHVEHVRTHTQQHRPLRPQSLNDRRREDTADEETGVDGTEREEGESGVLDDRALQVPH